MLSLAVDSSLLATASALSILCLDGNLFASNSHGMQSLVVRRLIKEQLLPAVSKPTLSRSKSLC